LALGLSVIAPHGVIAQGSPQDSTTDSTAALLRQAHELYERVDIERAVPLLERVLSPGWSFPATRAQRVDAYTYLAASLALVGATDSAARYFRAALEDDPFTDLDPRRFTPGQLAVFRTARRMTFAVGARQVSAGRVDPRTEQLPFTIVTTHGAVLRVEVRSVDGSASQIVFQGESDGLREIAWNGLMADGRLAPPGRYELRVDGRSRLLAGGRADSTRVYFDVRHELPALEDSLPELLPAQLRPERYPPSAATGDLLRGLGVAAGVALVAGPLADGRLGSNNAALPATVAGAAALSGVIAFVWRRHHPEAPENVLANARRRQERRLTNDAIQRRNSERIAQTILLIAPASGVGP
jgi:hypothetical protein